MTCSSVPLPLPPKFNPPLLQELEGVTGCQAAYQPQGSSNFPVVCRSSCVVLLASPSVCMCSDCVFVRLCVLRQRRRKAVEGQGIVKSAFSCQPTARMSKISLWLIRWSWQHTDCRQRDWQNTRAHARAHTHNSHTTHTQSHTQLTHDSHTQTLLAKKWASKAGKGTATVRMTTNWKGIAQESGY